VLPGARHPGPSWTLIPDNTTAVPLRGSAARAISMSPSWWECSPSRRSSARSAARLAHEVWRVGGKPASVLVRSRLVHMDHGYPVSADLPLLLDDSETMSFHGDGGAWQHMDLPPDHPCGVSYAPPGNDIDPPAIVLHDSGC